jgi:hypothetical protein
MKMGNEQGIESSTHAQAGNHLVQGQIFFCPLGQIKDDYLAHCQGNEQDNQHGYNNVQGQVGVVHRN